MIENRTMKNAIDRISHLAVTQERESYFCLMGGFFL
jgi:hypothetical protein